MSTEPKWLHPSTTSKIIDQAITVMTASGLNNMFIALEAEKGTPNEAIYFSSPSEFQFTFGDPNFTKYGQAGMNAYQNLRSGGGLWAIRVVPDDETFASISVGIGYNESQKYTNDEEEYEALTMTSDQIRLWNETIAASPEAMYSKGTATGKTVPMEKFYAGKDVEGVLTVQSKLGMMTADAIKVYNLSNGYAEGAPEALDSLAVRKEVAVRFGLKVGGRMKLEASIKHLQDQGNLSYEQFSLSGYKPLVIDAANGLETINVIPSELESAYESFAEAKTAAIAYGVDNSFTVLDITLENGFITSFLKVVDATLLENAYDNTPVSSSVVSGRVNFPYMGAFIYEITETNDFNDATVAANADLTDLSTGLAEAVTSADVTALGAFDSTYHYGPCYEETFEDASTVFSGLTLTSESLTLAVISSEAEWQYTYEAKFKDGTPAPASLVGVSAMTENYARWFNKNHEAYLAVDLIGVDDSPSTGVYDRVKTFFVKNASDNTVVNSTSMSADKIELFNTTVNDPDREVTANGELIDDGSKLSSQIVKISSVMNNTAKVMTSLTSPSAYDKTALSALVYLSSLFTFNSAEDETKEGYSTVTATLDSSDTFVANQVRNMNLSYRSILSLSGSTYSLIQDIGLSPNTNLVNIGLYNSSGVLQPVTFTLAFSVPTTFANILMANNATSLTTIALANSFTDNYGVSVTNVAPSVSYVISGTSYNMTLALSFYATSDSAELIRLNDNTGAMTFSAAAVGEYSAEKLFNVIYEDSLNEPNPKYIENVYKSIGICTTSFTNRDQDNISHDEMVLSDCKSGYIVTETKDEILTADPADLKLSNTRFIEFARFLPKGSGPWYNNLAVSLSYESSYDDTYPDWSMFTLSIIEKFNGSEIVRESFDVALDPDAISGTKESLFIENVINKYSSYLTCVSNYDNLVNFIETKMAITDSAGDVVKDAEGNTILPIVDKVIKYIFNRITLDELNASIFGDDYAIGEYSEYAYTDILSAIGYDANLCHLDTTLTDSTGEVAYSEPFVSKFYFKTLDTNATYYLAGGSRGNGWGYETIDPATDELVTTSTLDDALIRAYTGQTDPLITSVNSCVFDIVLDADYSVGVKTAMSELSALTRNDCITILDMNHDCANASQAVAKRKDQMQFNTYYTSIFSQSLKIDDVWTGKPVKVTPTYFLASKIPLNDSAYTEVYNFVGPRRGIISGYREVSWIPSEPEKTELYKNQINYIEEEEGSILFATENTSQKVTSPLSMIHAVRALLKLKRQMERASRIYRMEFAGADNIGLLQQDLNRIAGDKVLGGGFDYITPIVSQSAYDRQQKICRVKVDLAFTSIMERFVFEFVVNRA
jgi:hypothetical protein